MVWSLVTKSVAEDALARRGPEDCVVYSLVLVITPSRTAVYESEEHGRRIMDLTGYTDCQSKRVSVSAVARKADPGLRSSRSRCHSAVKEMLMLGTWR